LTLVSLATLIEMVPQVVLGDHPEKVINTVLPAIQGKMHRPTVTIPGYPARVLTIQESPAVLLIQLYRDILLDLEKWATSSKKMIEIHALA
jgi:hypothetical protein